MTAGSAASQRVNRRTSAQPEMSVPKVCSFRLPLTSTTRRPPRDRLTVLRARGPRASST